MFVFSVSSYVATIIQFAMYIAHNIALDHVFDIKWSKDSSTSDSFTLNDHRPIWYNDTVYPVSCIIDIKPCCVFNDLDIEY